MTQRTAFYAAAIVAAIIIALAGLWLASAQEEQTYRFEAVSEEIPVGKNVRLEIRVLGPDGQPVPSENVALTATRLDMGPDGMAAMDAPLKPVAAENASTLAFETEIVMAGRWALTIEARIKNHPDAVKAVVIYTAAEAKEHSDASDSDANSERKIVYYRNPMGLPDISKTPKKDSMGMDYIPVYEGEMDGPAGTVRVSPDKVQRAGVRIAKAESRALSREVRGAGMVMADEARLAVVTAKFSGFIQELDVRTSGESVEKGQRLLTAWVESGDLVNQMVDLAALAGDPKLGERAKNNLRLFDVPERDIEAIAKGGAPKRALSFNAPLSGTVLEKPAIDGMRFNAGDMLFRIADLSEVWVIVQVPEQDLAVVRKGQLAELTLPAMPGETLTGMVDFIYPELDMDTRSGRVRLRVPNPDGRLKLGLFAHALIKAPVEDAPVLAVPASAVIDDGERALVFVAKGDGRFEPRTIDTGARAGDFIAVRGGLAEGEEVVAQGTFLIDAESNLQAALAAFTSGDSAP